MQEQKPSVTAFRDHDHAACTKPLIETTVELCQKAGLRLTPVRRRTLEILLEAHRAIGAYDVLARLSEEGFGSQPPVAYRALEFLVEHGFAHRIRRLNAFTACHHPGEDHTPAFFICDDCGSVAEMQEMQVHNALRSAADRIGFVIARMNVEVLGTCPACQTGTSA